MIGGEIRAMWSERLVTPGGTMAITMTATSAHTTAVNRQLEHRAIRDLDMVNARTKPLQAISQSHCFAGRRAPRGEIARRGSRKASAAMAPYSMTSHLRVDRDGDIATVSLLAPTMPPALFTELGETFAGFASEPTLRAVILRGDTRVFSYGLDLPAAFASWGPTFAATGRAAARTELWNMVRAIQATITAVASCPAPVIAAVHSWCVGGGVDLITACDLRICTADARFSVRETKVAMVADLGSLQRLPLVIGDAATRELALTGKDIDASRALALGLVSQVVADRAALDAAAGALAAEIAGNPPLVVRGVKEILDQATRRDVAEGLERVAIWNAAFLPSEDLDEAAAAFAAKRPPAWKGR
jgi:enoyl-CoA hydratase